MYLEDTNRNNFSNNILQHEAIAAFPSKQFYDDRLEAGLPEQSSASPLSIWPSGSGSPIAFVHVVGVEQTLIVATDQGSEKSKSNQEEINIVVS